MKCKKKKIFKFFCFLITFLTLVASLYFSSDRIVVDYAVKCFYSSISSASYYAVDVIVDKKYRYADLVDVKTDKDGQISMVVTDSYEVNRLSMTVARNAFNYLTGEIKKGVDVPVCAFTGIRLISGFGPTVKMKVISVASVKCDMISTFTQAGINQTRHSLYLNINCTVNIVTKTATKTVNDAISVLVFDNLIVGKVPSVMITPFTIGKGEVKG